jgi:hypothetical protein
MLEVLDTIGNVPACTLLKVTKPTTVFDGPAAYCLEPGTMLLVDFAAGSCVSCFLDVHGDPVRVSLHAEYYNNVEIVEHPAFSSKNEPRYRVENLSMVGDVCWFLSMGMFFFVIDALVRIFLRTF